MLQQLQSYDELKSKDFPRRQLEQIRTMLEKLNKDTDKVMRSLVKVKTLSESWLNSKYKLGLSSAPVLAMEELQKTLESLGTDEPQESSFFDKIKKAL